MIRPTDRARSEGAPLTFPPPTPVMDHARARAIVIEALACWQCDHPEDAERIARTLVNEFPDHTAPGDFWNSASSSAFRDFFVWGHDHDFGHGVTRSGAMGPRHVEIASEALELGMLPATLAGKRVLDIGCWSGGDLLVLAGLGAEVTAIEEHPVAARSARRLAQLLKVSAEVVETSVYADRPDWAGAFDYAFCSGVIYHVTDPLLLLRILFAYLRPGGEVLLESKSTTGEGSVCSYSGTLEKGWNWYAPNETAMGRWLVDAGFESDGVRVFRRENGRLLAWAKKTGARRMRETAGFSRPGSWLEDMV